MVNLRQLSVIVLILLSVCFAFGQSKSKPSDKFRQLSEDELPTPNEQRTASGAPGNRYWQNRADYNIDVELDDVNQRITGNETVTYKTLRPIRLSIFGFSWTKISTRFENPYHKSAGDFIKFKVLFNGQPLKQKSVFAYNRAGKQIFIQQMQTDDKGECKLKIDRQGFWLIRLGKYGAVSEKL